MSKSLSLSPLSQVSLPLVRLNRILATSAGTDKVFMLYCYFSKVLVYALNSQRIGLGSKSALVLAEKLTKLATFTSDARVLYRLFGLLPIISWLQSMNNPAAQAKKDPVLAKVEYAQALAMLCYYPLEHYYYLGAKGMWYIEPTRMGKIARTSCRFWASYVVLQFVHMYRTRTLIANSRKALLANRVKALKDGESLSEEGKILEKTEAARIGGLAEKLSTDFWVQMGYLPLTMHWSLESGILPDPVWVGLFGTVAAVFGLKAAWRATA